MGRSATDRTYLSIREVLDLLVGEFPDVTISKIRFLESRGLIHPERTPSGYRKFYDHDVERLRWILRQQREHFLPLKVIKGRLENGPAPSLFDTEALAGDAPPAPAPPPANGVAVPAVDPTPDGAPPASGGAVPAADPAPAERVPADPVPEVPAPEALAAHARPDAPEAPVAKAPRRHAARSAPPAAPPPGEDSPADAQSPAVAADARAPAVAPGPLAGPCFSAEELSSACGADVDVVEELEEFGLVTGKTVAGVRVYDEHDLTVVRAAARLRRFGIEARHLRIFKHAAEREASLFSQVVTPLLRQRNPSARERAEQELVELTQLGAELQAQFVRAVLRELTGG